MKVSVLQDHFAKALSNVGRVANARNELAILNNILIRTDGNRLLVAATNLEIASTQYVGTKVETPGSITIPARLITEFISSLPSGQVELEVKAEQLHITSGRFSSVINGVVADEFPELPHIAEDETVRYEITLDDFKQAVTQTVLSASNDATRPVLTGVYWHSHDGSLYLAATDGYRLSERRLVATKSDVAAIIPTTTLQEVLRSMSEDNETVEVLFDETQVCFRFKEAEIVSRLIDGNFPDYRQLIPKQSETNVVINKAEFARVAKIAGLFARESGGGVTLSADGDNSLLSLHSIASELGENTSEATADIDTSGTVTLNSRYLIDALGVLEGDTVTFSFSGKLSPCVLTEKTKQPNFTHIIMPLKS